MSRSILYLGPLNGTSKHRHDALLRLGYEVHAVEPRGLLPASPWIDRFEWHVSPALLGLALEARLFPHIAGRHYDVALVDSGSLLTRNAIRRLHRQCERVINFNHDDPFGTRDRTRFSAFRDAIPEYDLLTVVREPNVQEAYALGARKVLRRFMVSDEVAHAPRPVPLDQHEKWRSDVAFIGSWMPERGEFLLDLIRRGVPLSIFGPGWSKAPEWAQLRPHHRADYLDGDEYAYAVLSAKVSLGLLSKGNRDGHTTRSMEIPALGGLFCGERTEEHAALYLDGVEAVLWRDAAECASACLALLADESRRADIAARGHERQRLNAHTSESLLSAMLEAA